jgi:hypothetical protein
MQVLPLIFFTMFIVTSQNSLQPREHAGGVIHDTRKSFDPTTTKN